jgi:hypothetical protein
MTGLSRVVDVPCRFDSLMRFVPADGAHGDGHEIACRVVLRLHASLELFVKLPPAGHQIQPPVTPCRTPVFRLDR